jgi:hypothetical protein
VSYRGESDALRARVEVLETQLAEANATIRELRGERRPPAPLPPQKNSLWLGAPSMFVAQRDFDVAPTRDLTERMALVFQREFPNGHALVTEHALMFRFGSLEAQLVGLPEGGSRLHMKVDHSGWGAFAPIFAAMIALMALPFAAGESSFVTLIGVMLLLAAATFFGIRQYMTSRVRHYRVECERIFESVAGVAPPKVRVAPYEESVMEEVDEEETAEERRL